MTIVVSSPSSICICICGRGLASTGTSLTQESNEKDYAEYNAKSADNYVADRQEVVCTPENVRSGEDERLAPLELLDIIVVCDLQIILPCW